MEYRYDKAKTAEKAKRTLDFYRTDRRGVAQIHIKGISGLGLPHMPPLNSFVFPEDTERYIDMLVRRDAAFAAFHDAIDDDFIPAAQPWYGIAEHSAFLGGKVDFSATTSYQHQIIKELSDFRSLTLSPDNMWMKMVAGGIEYIASEYKDVLPARMRGCHGISDLANAVRGADLCYDIYDSPDELRGFLDFCADAVKFSFGLQRRAATKIEGGIVNGFGVWMPGESIGQISEDFSCMLSVDTYREFFLPALRKLVSAHDSAMLHVHSLGADKIPLFCSVKGIDIMEISSDPNSDRAVNVWRKYHDTLDASGVSVIVAPTRDELFGLDDMLSSSKSVIWYYAESVEDAKRAVEFVRKYSL